MCIIIISYYPLIILWFLPTDTFINEGLTVIIIEQRLLLFPFSFSPIIMWVFEVIVLHGPLPFLLLSYYYYLPLPILLLFLLTQNITPAEEFKVCQYKSILHYYCLPILLLSCCLLLLFIRHRSNQKWLMYYYWHELLLLDLSNTINVCVLLDSSSLLQLSFILILAILLRRPWCLLPSLFPYSTPGRLMEKENLLLAMAIIPVAANVGIMGTPIGIIIT